MADYDRPHIDISPFLTTSSYKAHQSPGGRTFTRNRDQHGPRLSAGLVASLTAAEARRPAPDTLPHGVQPGGGAFVTVILHPNARELDLEKPKKGVRQSAAGEANGRRTMVLHMADEDAQAYLRERVESYLTGELNDRERPPLYSEMEPIDGFSPTELLDLWREDPGTLPTDANGSTWWGLWCWDDFVDDVTGVARALEMHVAPEDRWSSAIGKTERSALRRRFGYGMPDLSRALASASTDLALVSQAYIQPFDRPEISRRDAMRRVGPVTFGSAHYYDLPWPTRTLETLENCLVELKVTLSYFVEPYPLKGAMLDPARYRSFGLRFDLKRPRETNAEFQRRRNAEMGARIQAAEDDPNWAFGPKSIAAGSIHCDTWSGTAVELASRDQLAIYPVMGWWRDRPGQGRYLDKARYALVVTLTAPEAGIDLQAEVEIAARTRIAAQAQIAINMPRTGE